MMKRSLILVTLLLVALLVVLISVASAEPDQSAVIKCTADIVIDVYDDGIYWRGPVSGCSLEGWVEFRHNPEKENNPVGNMAHFYEIFTFHPDSGGWVHGFNDGIWNFSNLNFRAHGRVTSASEEWEHLIGANFFEKGTTSGGLTDPLPISALNTSMRVVPDRQ